MTVTDVTIPKKYVYVQSDSPTGASEGALWYDTDTSVLYSYDGSSWTDITQDVAYLEKQNLEQNINILINGASASSTLNDYEDMFLDLFTDADGEDDTVDTGNTTAYFSTNKYDNGTAIVDAHGETGAGTQSVTLKCGAKINTNTACTLTKVTKFGTSGATECYIATGADGSGQLATASFSGNDATFNLSLSDATTYYVLCDKGGSSFTSRGPGATYPISDTNLDWTAGVVSQSESSTEMRDVESVTTTVAPADKIVQTNMITITSNPTGHQVYCHNTTAGTGSVDYDISFDNGSTWVTGQSLNTKNTSVHAGSQMILKLNLNGTGSGNTAEASDYAIMLYY